MRERPIIFSTPMVKAILEGRKTMTRRVVKFPKDFTGDQVFDNSPYGLKYSNSPDTLERMACPYGVIGDRLWVRETFFGVLHNTEYQYRADKSEEENKSFKKWFNWTPSIYMPRAASRIILEITDVRVEMLQTISINDVEKEGIKLSTMMFIEFARLWEKINGDGSWAKPTWVWVIEYERMAK